MAEIVPFKRREPHSAGEAKCLDCGHEWASVAPVGVTALECPSCHSMRGLWKYPFGANVGESAFRCDCGSEHFHAVSRGGLAFLHCSACGADHTTSIWQG